MSPLTQRSKTQYGTYLVVTVITLLIWIWAAGETRNEDTVYARVKVVASSDFETIVSPIDDQQVAIEVRRDPLVRFNVCARCSVSHWH